MAHTWIQKSFAPLKRFLPRTISNAIRSLGTAILAPILWSLRTGHFKSSFKMAAVSPSGDPLPWYTYPCIDFLKYRSYEGRAILEFGAGQSTLWWAKRAAHVVSLEGDESWFLKLRSRIPPNVALSLVPTDNPDACVEAVNRVLSTLPNTQFDIIVIDGLWRFEMFAIAARVVKDDGIIICDDAEAEEYGFWEGFKAREFCRVDFFGNSPGTVLPHCTSVYFRPNSFVFKAGHPISGPLD